MLLAIPYLLTAYWCVTTIEAGGPGWLNLLVLLCAWNSMKAVTLNGPVTVILLLHDRSREAATRRRARRAEYERPDEFAEIHS